MPWRGAIEFAGIDMNIALHSMKKSRRTESFKTLAPNGQPPVTRDTVIDTDGNEIHKDELGKGVSLGRNQYARLSDEDVERIKSFSEKTTGIEPLSFAPVESLPREQALMSYWVTADDKVIGSEKNANILWNGLKATGLAYIAQVTISGTMDSLLAVWADDDGMWAATFPYAEELYPRPAWEKPAENERAQSMFAMMVEEFEVKPFDSSEWHSEYKARRDEAVSAILDGVVLEPVAPKPVKSDAPDLLAAMEAKLKLKGKGKVAADAPKVERRTRAKAA